MDEPQKMPKVVKPPKKKNSDPEELADYQHRKRLAFEDNISKYRSVIRIWIEYAKWEESQGELERALIIYERALNVTHLSLPLWLRYNDLDMSNSLFNNALNLWERIGKILPWADEFWHKYIGLEEKLNNIAVLSHSEVREMFERWMEGEPEEEVWLSYIKFELRNKEIDRSRDIYRRFVIVHPDVKNWLKYAKFEEMYGSVLRARNVYLKALEFFGENTVDEKLLIGFAKFEESIREHARAGIIYKHIQNRGPKARSAWMEIAYTGYVKKYGYPPRIPHFIGCRKKFQFEEELLADPNNYDAWCDYLHLVKEEGNLEVIRETYKRAIDNVPLIKEKKFWRHYVSICIGYARFEEVVAKDEEQARQVYRACLDLIPHKTFTFATIWLDYAEFEIRHKNLTVARKTLGEALRICPKDKLFRGFIELENKLQEFDQCRILYKQFLEFGPENCITWMKFAELETLLGDSERARSIYESAMSQPDLDVPELLWEAFIDFEIGQGEVVRARQLYEQESKRTHYAEVWISYAQFELASSTADIDNVALARRVYERGNIALRNLGHNEERVLLLEAWRDMELKHGDNTTIQKLESKMPRRVKKRRVKKLGFKWRQKVTAQDGTDEEWEEFFDYVFPEDEATEP